MAWQWEERRKVIARWHEFLELQLAMRPDAHAFSDDGGARWTFSELSDAAGDVELILHEAGVEAGDKILLLAENCAAVVAVLIAGSRLGATVIPFNARQTETEIDRVLDHAAPAAIILTSAASPDAADHARRMDASSIAGRFGNLHLKIRNGVSDADADMAVILYTTGTTGAPKGVMLTHANMRSGGMSSARLREMTPDDLIYGALPITHVFGLVSVVVAATYAGAAVRLEARFTAAKLHTALKDGVTLLSAVPRMHALLMEYVKERGGDRLCDHTLRYVSSGAAPLDRWWKRKAEAFYGVAVQNGYGMTETAAGICATRSTIGDPDVSVGPPLSGVEVRIDETTTGDGTGEVLVRGPNVMKGYYRNPDETARTLDAKGWMRTGDLGWIDERGFLNLLGRRKELIIHGGFNVYPPEVEAVLNDHPQVMQSAVIGHEVQGDEKVVAFVQVAEGQELTAENLHAFAAKRLTGYKRPSRIIITTSLPAAPTGKILKNKLLEVFADRFDDIDPEVNRPNKRSAT